jgi:Uma2 family endonuclease
MYQQHPPRWSPTDQGSTAADALPTMYDLPSESLEDLGLPDEFHDFQPQLLRETCQPPTYAASEIFIGTDLNLYYDGKRPQWYKRPDWFLVLGTDAAERQEELRWSYVTWQESMNPFLVVELLSPGTEDEDLGRKLRELGKPPLKWEVYERILRIPFYVVFDRYEHQLRVFSLEGGNYRALELTEPRYWFEPVGLGLGVWTGPYQGVIGQWLRWYDRSGDWIPTNAERAVLNADRADRAEAIATAEAQARREAIPRLKALGLSVEQVADALGLPIAEIESV